MTKKIVKGKIKKRSSNMNVSMHLLRYLSSVLSIWLIASLGLFFFPQQISDKIPCANSISCAKDLSVQVENGKPGVFLGKKIFPPRITLTDKTFFSKTSVLGSETGGKKIIYVDLDTQTLYAYQGNSLVYTFPVSTGKWGPTPTGVFTIWVKLVATRMTGGEGADAYDLPNVPYTMFYYNSEIPKDRGYSLHGAYWHNNFSHPMSHGCVNLRPEDAKKLYDWADPQTAGYTTYATNTNQGTQVVIYGTPPLE